MKTIACLILVTADLILALPSFSAGLPAGEKKHRYDLSASELAITVATPAAPTIQTNGPSQVQPTSVQFNGSVIANNSPTVAWFDWGTTTSYGNTTSSQDGGSE